jgi:hypothetical protein
VEERDEAVAGALGERAMDHGVMRVCCSSWVRRDMRGSPHGAEADVAEREHVAAGPVAGLKREVPFDRPPRVRMLGEWIHRGLRDGLG